VVTIKENGAKEEIVIIKTLLSQNAEWDMKVFSGFNPPSRGDTGASVRRFVVIQGFAHLLPESLFLTVAVLTPFVDDERRMAPRIDIARTN
jgi:hypothetical protein